MVPELSDGLANAHWSAHFPVGARSAPNLFDPTSAGVLVRQRGAHSRIGIDGSFVVVRLPIAEGWGDLACAKEETMPKEKDLKRLIRARMTRTGEAYTTARAHVLASSPSADAAANTATTDTAALTDERGAAPPLPDDYEKVAGMSDDAVFKATGKRWPEWVAWLDAVDAANMPHGKIAAHLAESTDIGGWWSQMVTVAYERLRGLREVGQRRDGVYEANRSRTIAAPLDAVWNAFADEARRKEWCGSLRIDFHHLAYPKSMRGKTPDGTKVIAYFTDKGEKKCTVAVQHTDLPDREAADQARAEWSERLDALKASLAE